jgi:hypothetical protein
LLGEILKYNLYYLRIFDKTSGHLYIFKASWSFFLYSDFELDDARFSCIQLLVVRNVNCLLEIELMGMLAAMEFDEIIAKLDDAQL